MTRSELIELLARRQEHLSPRDVEMAVKCILGQMSSALAAGERIEVRGFGSFSLHYRRPRQGRNPKTGEQVILGSRYVPHFKPGKELRLQVNNLSQDKAEHAHAVGKLSQDKAEHAHAVGKA